ncbi:MAG TPA: DJ-1/PfpI family protein, partial [bacterium]|nr:DJ-1/PfpI family protein [bacterium]
ARDDFGLGLLPSQVGGSLAGYDLVYLPGGLATRRLMKDETFLGWLATAKDCPLKVSVCSGALLWGSLGYLKGKAATTHPGAYELLRPLCARVVEDQRVVDQGAIITARGVSTSLDLGLYVCQRLAGPAAAQAIRIQMDYPYGLAKPA